MGWRHFKKKINFKARRNSFSDRNMASAIAAIAVFIFLTAALLVPFV